MCLKHFSPHQEHFVALLQKGNLWRATSEETDDFDLNLNLNLLSGKARPTLRLQMTFQEWSVRSRTRNNDAKIKNLKACLHRWRRKKKRILTISKHCLSASMCWRLGSFNFTLLFRAFLRWAITKTRGLCRGSKFREATCFHKEVLGFSGIKGNTFQPFSVCTAYRKTNTCG